MPDLSDAATLSAGALLAGGAETAAAARGAADRPATFILYHRGPITVIGWDGAEAVDARPDDFLSETADLVSGASADVLAVDLGGLEDYRPGLLGGLAALVRRGTRVLLFDPTENLREVLRISKLDQVLGVHSAEAAD